MGKGKGFVSQLVVEFVQCSLCLFQLLRFNSIQGWLHSCKSVYHSDMTYNERVVHIEPHHLAARGGRGALVLVPWVEPVPVF